MSTTKTNALLPIEDRTGRSNSRNQHQQKHQWQPERQRKQNAGKIEKRFPARHLWFGRHRHSGPDANKVRQRVHGQAAALGHPPDIGKVSCYLYLVELLQTAVTLLFLQDPQNEKEERACELPPSSRKRGRGVDPRAVHSQNSGKRLPTPQAGTGFRHAAFCHR